MKTVATVLLLSPFGDALRRQSQSQASSETSMSFLNASGLPEIKEKWEKMDDFMEIMFTIACKWKHGKDVNGEVSEKLRAGEITGAEAVALKKDMQKENLKFMKASCGGVVAQQKGKCRQSCADRWGVMKAKRAHCDDLCVKNFDRWEAECNTKAVNLEKVYEMKLTAANSRNQCYNGHCQHFPQVWMRADAAEMNAEVDKQCQNECTTDRIKQRCETKWQLQMDFVLNEINSECFGEGKMKECFSAEKATIDAEYQTCKEGVSTCQTQFDQCNTDGKTSENFEQGKQFCEQRKQMCEEQVSKDCLQKNRELLDGAQLKCEQEDSGAYKSCKETKLTEKKDAAVSACESESTPKCDADCRKKCDVDKMSKCLQDLESPHDAGEAFCKDFWHLIHETSQLDKNGDPVVA